MPTMLAPVVSVEAVDPGVPAMSERTRGMTRNVIEQGCRRELHWLAYEENRPRTWSQIVQNIREFLFVLWAREALKGARANDAFYVTRDWTTMTPDDHREGTLNCLVGVAPMKPSEFLLYRVRIQLKPH
jgi:phage tail sheath protein FI